MKTFTYKQAIEVLNKYFNCLLYTSDAADE